MDLEKFNQRTIAIIVSPLLLSHLPLFLQKRNGKNS